MTLHEALKLIHEDVEKQRWKIATPKLGICRALFLATHSVSMADDFEKLSAAWPLCSGNHNYPVPYPSNHPETAFNDAVSNGSMWDMSTVYGRNRMALLEWAIEQTEPEVVE